MKYTPTLAFSILLFAFMIAPSSSFAQSGNYAAIAGITTTMNHVETMPMYDLLRLEKRIGLDFQSDEGLERVFDSFSEKMLSEGWRLNWTQRLSERTENARGIAADYTLGKRHVRIEVIQRTNDSYELMAFRY